MADTLYDHDYYAWTQEQADLLRRREPGANALDWDHLAEEVVNLGSEQLHKCESWITQIIAHFLKLEYSAFEDPRPGWIGEITGWRIAIRRRLTASLESKIRLEWQSLYEDAVKIARASFRQHEPETQFAPPPVCPYSWEDVMGRGEDWVPGGKDAPS